MYNRLDEVKRQHEGQKKIDFFGPTLHPRDVDWLIEQAEKVELLNAEKELLQAKWEAQGLMIQKLHEENKKYKERNIQQAFTVEKKNIQIDDLTHELLFYSDPSNYIAIAHLSEQSRLAEDLGERARKALRRKR